VICVGIILRVLNLQRTVYYKRCLSVKKIEQSLEHADVLNSITEQKSIDDLVSEALQSDIAKNCTCDICEFVKNT